MASYKIVENPYEDKHSKNRKGLMPSGRWNVSFTKVIRQKGIKALYLNTARGWRDEDYSFLRDLDTIEELGIIDAGGRNIEAIEGMTSLQELSLTQFPKSTIDFSKLPNLEKCFLSWWSGASSIFQTKSLKELYIDRLNLKDFSPLANLGTVEKLTIGNANISELKVLNKLENLTHLSLLNCRKISDFTPIGELRGLIWLDISGSSQVSSLDFVKALRKLEVLLVGDVHDIESLKPLSELKNLKALALPGAKTNIVDGDLNHLKKLKNLSMLMIAPRKHYTHKLVKAWNWDNFGKPDILLKEK